MITDWCTEPLGRHTEIRARIGWRGLSASEYRREGPFLIAGQHLLDGRVDWEQCDHLSEFRYQESPEIALKPGDVILSKDGTIGRVARIDTLPGPATLNGTMMLLRPRQSLDYRYLYHFLGGRGFHKLIEDKVSGSSIPHIFQRDMVSLPIVLPHLAEQRRIATTLDTVDEAIAKTEAVITKLRQVRTGLLHDLLTRGLDENGKIRDPLNHREEFKNSTFGSIPIAWSYETFGSLGNWIGGKTPSKDSSEFWNNGHTLWVTPKDVGGSLVDDTADKLTTAGAEGMQLFKEGSLLVVGRSGILRHTLPAAICSKEFTINQDLKVFVPNEPSENSGSFLLLVLQSRSDEIRNRVVKTGTTVESVDWNTFRNYGFGWPRKDERGSILATIAPVDRELKVLSGECAKLVAVKSGLMSDLLTGRVRMPGGII